MPTRINSTATECCKDSPCGSGLRNNYFVGKARTPATYQVEQAYSLERRRLLNRTIHGWGVVFGLKVEARDGGVLSVGEGLALDARGRELLQTAEVSIDIEAALKLGGPASNPEAQTGCWLLAVHYAERSLDPVQVKDRCDCEHTEWDLVCETVLYSLTPVDCEDCCADDDNLIDSGCCGEPCCGECASRGGRCVCEHLTNLEVPFEKGRLCEIDKPCGGVVRVDREIKVDLACIVLKKNDCRWEVELKDQCGPRRLVKRNDLLFDLIQGRDLTRIADFGWKRWHRRAEPVPQAEFAPAIGARGLQKRPTYRTRDFWVEFSRPVLRETVRADCFAMTFLMFERKEHWWESYRVPIVDVVTEPDSEHVTKATIVVDGKWLEDVIEGATSDYPGEGTRVEIEVRGDFIIDCNGQTIDANAHGLGVDRSGNGTPGGTFVSTFSIVPDGKSLS